LEQITQAWVLLFPFLATVEVEEKRRMILLFVSQDLLHCVLSS
jgi:hypothetical protein